MCERSVVVHGRGEGDEWCVKGVWWYMGGGG